jgi:transposase InsO family protein
MLWFYDNPDAREWPMNALYSVLGVSKQSFYQQRDRLRRDHEEYHTLLQLVREVRIDHPTMSARVMHEFLKLESIGRDKFEQLCFEGGYKLERKRAFHKTTDSTGVIRFPNLVAGREVTGVNQVWVSDITYYRIDNIFYYLTFIMDLYSRRIVGYSVSRDRSTEQTTIPALKMALRNRSLAGELILHSDGGGQYYSDNFLKLSSDPLIAHSMGICAYDNAYAERINGTIKNGYLAGYAPFSYQDLLRKTAKAVHMYNEQRPHRSLNKMSPVAFEQSGILKPTYVYNNA